MDVLDSRSLQATWETLPSASLRGIESCCPAGSLLANAPYPGFLAWNGCAESRPA